MDQRLHFLLGNWSSLFDKLFAFGAVVGFLQFLTWCVVFATASQDNDLDGITGSCPLNSSEPVLNGRHVNMQSRLWMLGIYSVGQRWQCIVSCGSVECQFSDAGTWKSNCKCLKQRNRRCHGIYCFQQRKKSIKKKRFTKDVPCQQHLVYK